jgi:hypothetical protein
MNYDDLKNKFEINKKIKFKLYSLEYVVEMIDNKFIIYPEIYSKRKSSYISFDDMMNNFTVYNESLMENISKILIIE